MKKYILIILFFASLISAMGQEGKWRRLIRYDTYDCWENPYNPNTMVVGGGGRVVWLTQDAGETWKKIPIEWEGGPALFNNVLIHPNDTNLIIVGGLNFGTIRRSADLGETWDICLEIPNDRVSCNGKAIHMKPGAEDTIFVGEYRSGKIFRSPDRGATWDTISTVKTITKIQDPDTGEIRDTSVSLLIGCIGIRPDSSDILFAGGTNGEMHISNDGGYTWRLLQSLNKPAYFQEDGEITRIAFSEQNPMHGYAVITYLYYDNLPNGGLHRTTDGGYSWERVAFQDTSMWAVAVRKYPKGFDDEVFIGGYTENFLADDSVRVPGLGIVMRSHDHCKSWYNYKNINWSPPKPTAEPIPNVWSMRFFGPKGNEKLYMATEAGFFVLDEPEEPPLVADSDGGLKIHVSEDMRLYAIYERKEKNVANPLQFRIVNMSGQIVFETVLKDIQANYITEEIDLSGVNLPFEAYVCQVIENGKSSTYKIVWK